VSSGPDLNSSWTSLRRRAQTKRPSGKRYFIPSPVAAKAVQLHLLQQRVVSTAQKAQADVLLHRLHYVLPGWDAAAGRCKAQGEFHCVA
jgi:hypothetical protein